MAIITRKRDDNYFIMPNPVAEDPRLTFEAVGMMAYLLAKPNDWTINIDDLRRAGGAGDKRIGKDKVYGLIKLLRETGYIERVVKRGEGGRILSQEYLVHNVAIPQQLPLPENPEQAEPLPENPEMADPVPENPEPEKPDTENQQGLISTQTQQEPKLIKTQPPPFDAFWKTWAVEHRPDSRKSAENLHNGLEDDNEREKARKFAAIYQRRMFLLKKKPRMITYLRERAWHELEDAPMFDRDGQFVITPEYREEWSAWLGDVRRKYGENAVQTAVMQKRMVRDTRWPEPAEAQTA